MHGIVPPPYSYPIYRPLADIRLPITLNHLISISFVGPGDQLPACESNLFKHFSLPKDKERPFDRKNFVNELVRVCGNFEVYPHDYYDFMFRIDTWSRSRVRYWQRIYDVLNADYEPLQNYDRTEHETIKDDKKSESSANSKIAGFDSGELVDDSSASGNNKDDDFRDRNVRAYGNIGVTTSQEMLQQEINVAQISMVKIIIDEFKETFCILLY